MAWDENIEAFIVHMSSLSLGLKITIHLAWEAQIALLLTKKVILLAKYTDFVDIFLKELAAILLECFGINEHTIKLENSKQLPYEPICSLSLVKLEIFKT